MLYSSKTWNAVFSDSAYKSAIFIWKNKTHQIQGSIREVFKFSKPKSVITKPKKSHQPKLYPQNKSSVAKEEKSKKWRQS